MTFALAEKQLEVGMLPQVRSLTDKYLGELSKYVIKITNRRRKFHKLFTRSLLFAAEIKLAALVGVSGNQKSLVLSS